MHQALIKKPLSEILLSDSGPTIQPFYPPETSGYISGPDAKIYKNIITVKNYFLR